ncbi:MAG: hypothetical protein IPH59_14060 [bacterium]|nr:hypothetical protein [bacterium]
MEYKLRVSILYEFLLYEQAGNLQNSRMLAGSGMPQAETERSVVPDNYWNSDCGGQSADSRDFLRQIEEPAKRLRLAGTELNWIPAEVYPAF